MSDSGVSHEDVLLVADAIGRASQALSISAVEKYAVATGGGGGGACEEEEVLERCQ